MERVEGEKPGGQLTEVQKEGRMEEGGVRKEGDRGEEEAKHGRKKRDEREGGAEGSETRKKSFAEEDRWTDLK